MVYPALLPLMRTPRLPVVDWTDSPADLNGLVPFAERRNLVSARVPSHFKRGLTWLPLENRGIRIISPHYCSTTPVHGELLMNCYAQVLLSFSVRFIRFWNNAWDLRFLWGEYEDCRYLGCDAVWFGGCQLLEGRSALKMLRSKCYWSPSDRLQRVTSQEALCCWIPTYFGSRCEVLFLKNDITSVAVLCIVLSHELSKLGSNRASCLDGLGFEPRPRDGQGFRIFLFTSEKCWRSYFI